MIKDRKKFLLFTVLCCAAYFTAYLNRYNFGAAISEIIRDTGETKEKVSVAVTLCFISYGAGQIINGLLGDRFSPRLMVFTGLLASSLCNLAVALFPELKVMTFVWLINGFAQSMLWPPLVRLMSGLLTNEYYRRTASAVSISAACATILIYLIVPACIRISGWRSAFALPGCIGLAVSVVWLAGISGIEKAGGYSVSRAGTEAFPAPKASVKWLISAAGLAPMMAAVVLQGILRDGVSTWTPTLLTEVFRLDTSVSILTSVVVPLFGVLAMLSAGKADGRLKNESLTAAVYFSLAGISAALLIPFYSVNPALSVLLLAIISGSMHGTNLLIISHVCSRFSAYGRASTISGIMNACVYIGSALSTYGTAALSTKFGWRSTALVWLVIAVLAAVCCGTVVKKWKRFTEQLPEE